MWDAKPMHIRIGRVGDQINQRPNQTDAQTAKHGSYEITNAAQYGCGKGDEAKPKPNSEFGSRELQKENEAGCAPPAPRQPEK